MSCVTRYKKSLLMLKRVERVVVVFCAHIMYRFVRPIEVTRDLVLCKLHIQGYGLMVVQAL